MQRLLGAAGRGSALRAGSCSSGSSSPCRSASRSRCRCSRCTPGCRWPTSRRRRPAACCSPACCSSSAPTASCGCACRSRPTQRSRVGVPLLGTLAVIGIIYGRSARCAQDDIKKLVAYSSVSATSASACSACSPQRGRPDRQPVADDQSRPLDRRAVPARRHDLRALPHAQDGRLRRHGRAAQAASALFMVFICLSSVGLPGLNGFVGEMLVLAGMYDFERT